MKFLQLFLVLFGIIFSPITSYAQEMYTTTTLNVRAALIQIPKSLQLLVTILKLKQLVMWMIGSVSDLAINYTLSRKNTFQPIHNQNCIVKKIYISFHTLSMLKWDVNHGKIKFIRAQ